MQKIAGPAGSSSPPSKRTRTSARTTSQQNARDATYRVNRGSDPRLRRSGGNSRPRLSPPDASPASRAGWKLSDAPAQAPSGATGRTGARPCRDPGAGGGRPGAARRGPGPTSHVHPISRGQRPAIDRGVNGKGKRGDAIRVGVGAPQDLTFELPRQEPMAALRLDRELSRLDAGPSNQLRGGARSLARNVDADDAKDESGRSRREERPAVAGFVSPVHERLGVGVAAECAEDRLNDGHHGVRGGRPRRCVRSPLAQPHRVSLVWAAFDWRS